MQYRLSQIPSGERGTDATVKAICELVSQSLQRPYIRQLALDVIKKSESRTPSPAQQAQSLYYYVRDNIAYVQDPIGVETVQSPENTVKLRAGDCDDHSALIAALSMAIGIPARFRVIGVHNDRFAHIFPELNLSGRWIPCDTTIRKYFGYRAPIMPAEKIYNFEGDEIMNVSQYMATSPITKSVAEKVTYNSVIRTLKSNWNSGKINLDDVQGYLRVIDEGNSPARGTMFEPIMRKAIVDFITQVKRYGLVSAKPIGAMNGLEGLDGFLSSIWSGVKKAVGGVVSVVKGAVKVVTGGSTPTVTVNPPTINIPQGAVQTTVSPGAAAAAAESGVASVLNSPVTWIAIAAGVFLLMRR